MLTISVTATATSPYTITNYSWEKSTLVNGEYSAYSSVGGNSSILSTQISASTYFKCLITASDNSTKYSNTVLWTYP